MPGLDPQDLGVRRRPARSTKLGSSGRGPTRLISPRSTFQSCGISSSFVLARKRPRRVKRSSSAAVSAGRRASSRIFRNLSIPNSSRPVAHAAAAVEGRPAAVEPDRDATTARITGSSTSSSSAAARRRARFARSGRAGARPRATRSAPGAWWATASARSDVRSLRSRSNRPQRFLSSLARERTPRRPGFANGSFGYSRTREISQGISTRSGEISEVRMS